MKSSNIQLIIAVFLLVGTIGKAQNSYTLSGYMKDASTGEELLYANIYAIEAAQGATTNLYGFYSITLPEGKYKIQYSYLGYEPQFFELDLSQDVKKDVELQLAASELQEVVVKAEKEDENLSTTEMGTVKLSMKEIKSLPVLFGEQDVLKTIQLMPGVSSAGEGSTGFYVRGGNVDQNLILLDEAPVYNASHLLGFFSVFNGDALKDMKLYKAGIPAEYGGRLSSILDVRMKEGNSKEFKASGGVGLIASRLTLEAPIVKDKGSFIISGRRTYADLIAGAVDQDFSSTTLYFYDLNMKANYKISEKDRIFLSGYLGRDEFGNEDFGFDWGNATATLRWNHLFNDQLFSNTTLIYSDYDYSVGLDRSEDYFNISSGIKDYNLKQDFIYYPKANTTIKFGANAIYHTFEPGSREAEINEEANTFIIDERNALEGGLYISAEQKLGRLNINYGLRASSFSLIGPDDVKTYNEENEVTSITSYDEGEFYKSYFGLEPRVSSSYILNDKSSIKASYNRTYQYLHLLSNSSSGTPTDIWTPSSEIVKPEIADQISLGYYRNFKDNTYQFSIETYYKNLQNQVDYEDGADIFLNEDIESQLVFGKGRSYGAEFLLRKTKGRLTGWLGYTLSKTENQFEEINDGAWFSARQDRTHDISIVALYELNDKWTLSANWVYNTGDAVTFPEGKYEIDGVVNYLYTDRNGYRMPSYHRLDFGGNDETETNRKIQIRS